jgi:hypothetical protein
VADALKVDVPVTVAPGAWRGAVATVVAALVAPCDAAVPRALVPSSGAGVAAAGPAASAGGGVAAMKLAGGGEAVAPAVAAVAAVASPAAAPGAVVIAPTNMVPSDLTMSAGAAAASVPTRADACADAAGEPCPLHGAGRACAWDRTSEAPATMAPATLVAVRT